MEIEHMLEDLLSIFDEAEITINAKKYLEDGTTKSINLSINVESNDEL
ncbi:hypothetical protein AB4452_04625 [Vibrio lentus]